MRSKTLYIVYSLYFRLINLIKTIRVEDGYTNLCEKREVRSGGDVSVRYAIIRLTMKFHNNKIVTITILPGVSRKCISCLIWSLDSFSIHSLAALAKGQLILKANFKVFI